MAVGAVEELVAAHAAHIGELSNGVTRQCLCNSEAPCVGIGHLVVALLIRLQARSAVLVQTLRNLKLRMCRAIHILSRDVRADVAALNVVTVETVGAGVSGIEVERTDWTAHGAAGIVTRDLVAIGSEAGANHCFAGAEYVIGNANAWIHQEQLTLPSGRWNLRGDVMPEQSSVRRWAGRVVVRRGSQTCVPPILSYH